MAACVPVVAVNRRVWAGRGYDTTSAGGLTSPSSHRFDDYLPMTFGFLYPKSTRSKCSAFTAGRSEHYATPMKVPVLLLQNVQDSVQQS